MTMPPYPHNPELPASADLLTDGERDRLLANLHRTLVWVGVQDPERLEIDADLLRKEMEKDGIGPVDLPPEVHPAAGTVDLRRLIWRLIHLSDLSEKEETVAKELIEVLKAKEVRGEERLKEARLTREEARRIYDETAAVIRSLLDLRDILAKKEHNTDLGRKIAKKKVDDVKRWNAFVDSMEGK